MVQLLLLLVLVVLGVVLALVRMQSRRLRDVVSLNRRLSALIAGKHPVFRVSPSGLVDRVRTDSHGIVLPPAGLMSQKSQAVR